MNKCCTPKGQISRYVDCKGCDQKPYQEEDIIEAELWDHYSGLPNPSWYAYKNKLNEKKNSNSSNDDTDATTQMET